MSHRLSMNPDSPNYSNDDPTWGEPRPEEEDRAMSEDAKFVQLVVDQSEVGRRGELVALDADGLVWRYSFDRMEWIEQPMTRRRKRP